ncbi:hypothetical protein C0J52_26099 [Blattella germanica]|nr:hypothetical protein C0J52_26099 [Blattella germanica]
MAHHSHPHSYQQGEYDEDEYDGQMMSGDRLGLKRNPKKNLTQETCPDRKSNPGSLRERRIRYPLLHNGRKIIIKLKIYKTVILPVILYGCETWTLTLKEEKRLRVFENKKAYNGIWREKIWCLTN